MKTGDMMFYNFSNGAQIIYLPVRVLKITAKRVIIQDFKWNRVRIVKAKNLYQSIPVELLRRPQ